MHAQSIPIDRLVPDPTQPRTSTADGSFDRLVASIRVRGLLQPVRVRPADAAGSHAIVFGHRRVAALTELGATHADGVVADGPPDEAVILADQLTENTIREDLSPIEEAEGFRRYLALRAVTAAQAAAELSVPASRVSRCLALLDLPEAVLAHVHAGRVHQDTAYHLSRLPTGDRRDQMIARAVAGDLTRDAAARAAKARGPKPNSSPAVGRVTCKLAGGRSLTVSGGPVTLDSFIETLEGVLKEARKGRAQAWDVSTLAKVFRDRAAKGGAA